MYHSITNDFFILSHAGNTKIQIVSNRVFQWNYKQRDWEKVWFWSTSKYRKMFILKYFKIAKKFDYEVLIYFSFQAFPFSWSLPHCRMHRSTSGLNNSCDIRISPWRTAVARVIRLSGLRDTTGSNIRMKRARVGLLLRPGQTYVNWVSIQYLNIW